MLTEFVLSQRLMAGGVLAGIVLAVSAGLAFFDVDFSAKLFYGTQDPETVYLMKYAEEWGADDLMVVVVDGGGTTLLTRERMARLESVRQHVQAYESVAETRTLADHKRPRLSMFQGVKSVPLLETMPTESGLDAWRESVLSDDAIVPGLLSEDGRKATILLNLTVDTDDMAMNRQILHGLTKILDTSEGEDGLSYSLAGIPSLRGSVIDAIVSDQLILIPTAGALIIVLLLLMFRSRHGVLVPLVACVVPLMMLLGAMGFLGQDLDLLNQTFLVLIPAIAIADAIHLVSRYHEETRAVTDPGQPHTSKSQKLAIVAAMRHMGLACLFTSITTIIGFLSLGFTQMAVLRNYGFYAALGIFFAYFTVLFIVPLALSGTRRAAPLSSQDDKGWLGALLSGCADLSYRHPRYSLIVTAGIVFVAIAYGNTVDVDNRFSSVLADEHPVSVANNNLDEHLGGVVGVEFDIHGPDGALGELKNLGLLRDVENVLKADPDVRTAFGPAFLVSVLYEQSSGTRTLPPTGDDVEGLFKLADMDSGRAILVNRERNHGRIAVRMRDTGGTAFLETAERLNQETQRLLEGSELSAHMTGTTYVSYRGVNRVTSDLRNSLLGAFLIIALLVAILFKSVRFGLLSIVPNTVPLILAYGAMGVLDWKLDTAPAVVFTVALGLAVDSSIHVFARFNEEMKAGRSAAESVHRSVMSSGRAIAITSVILAVAFFVNTFSSFPDNAEFGVLGAVIVMGALMANLVVLPSLLALVYGGDSQSEAEAA